MIENQSLKIVKEDIFQAVIDSQVLASSKNQRALFDYLLSYHFESKDSGKLKTVNIAIDVFGRDESFKAKTDSIVRVEMHRLRANLTRFNALSKELIIELPKSSYALQITQIEPEKEEDQPEVKNKRGLYSAGLVTAMGALSLVFATAFNRDMAAFDCSQTIPNLDVSVTENESDLTPYIHQVILSAASQYKHFNIVKDAQACDHTITPDYTLAFALLNKGRGLEGNVVVTSHPTGRVVGSGDLGQEIDIQSEGDALKYKLSKITNDLLKPSAVVHRDAVNQNWKTVDIREDYSCLLKMHDSFVSDSDEDFYIGLSCLENAYKSGTTSLENLGALAASYLEQAQGNRLALNGDPLQKAETILNEVGDRWLLSPETTLAKIMYDSLPQRLNVQLLKETLLHAEQAYPTHPAVLLDISRYSGFMLGDWELALKNVNKVKRLISARDNSIEQVNAAYALLFDENRVDWKSCLKAYSEHSKVSNLLVHACALKYEKSLWEKKTNENLIKANLDGLKEKEAFIKQMGFEPSLSSYLLRSQ